MLAFEALDSTLTFEINGKEYPIVNGICNIKFPCNKKGEFEWKGVLKYKYGGDDCGTHIFDVSDKYGVK